MKNLKYIADLISSVAVIALMFTIFYKKYKHDENPSIFDLLLIIILLVW